MHVFEIVTFQAVFLTLLNVLLTCFKKVQFFFYEIHKNLTICPDCPECHTSFEISTFYAVLYIYRTRAIITRS